MMHWKLKYLMISISLITIVTMYDPVRSFIFPSRSEFKIEDFAGAYHLGEGFDLVKPMELKDDWTFDLKVISSRGTWKVAQGTLSWDMDRLYLTHDEVDAAEIEFVLPVLWGERRYLIPYFADDTEDAIEAFCQSVRIGEEPRKERSGWFYLQNGHWDWPADGLPATPWGAELCLN